METRLTTKNVDYDNATRVTIRIGGWSNYLQIPNDSSPEAIVKGLEELAGAIKRKFKIKGSE